MADTPKANDWHGRYHVPGYLREAKQRRAARARDAEDRLNQEQSGPPKSVDDVVDSEGSKKESLPFWFKFNFIPNFAKTSRITDTRPKLLMRLVRTRVISDMLKPGAPPAMDMLIEEIDERFISLNRKAADSAVELAMNDMRKEAAEAEEKSTAVI